MLVTLLMRNLMCNLEMVKYTACWCYVLIRSSNHVYYRHVWSQTEHNRVVCDSFETCLNIEVLKDSTSHLWAIINCIMNIILEVVTEGLWLFNHFVALKFVFLSQKRRTFLFLFWTGIHTSVAWSKQNGNEKLYWLCGCLH